ncbi:UNVERIFIED_ORG: putative membrane protein [Martelella mediterranea]
MSDPETTPPPRFGDGWMDPTKNNVILIYILYLVSCVIFIAGIIGLISAYMNRDKAEDWLKTHYTWAIRTFWIALLFSAISFVLTFVLIGILGFVATGVWVIVRMIVGLQKVNRSEPIERPESWLV